MNKTALRKFSVQARKKLVDAVRQKAYTFGITEKGITPIEELQDGLIINGTVLGERELRRYTHLKNRIISEGYDQVMEEGAYTWFNRLVALRYMEVNDFLPIHMRILSSETPGKTEPDALTNILSLTNELDLNRERVFQLQDSNKINDLYQYLLVKQSNKLGEIIPNVFEHISDDLALLLPDNLLNENSIVRDIVTMIDEEDWKNVEIVGWLYQFYISEQKESFFSHKKKAEKEDIGPATQLFTPRWIVEYMVDNSLGRLWLESHPNEDLQKTLEYYLEDAKQTKESQTRLDALKDPTLDIESVKFFDPACGSGHIMVYAFELFHKIYLSRGYLEREIPKLILENNLYGLDIDKRAAQLATFAVVMKAREYDRRLFNRDYSVHIHSIEESNQITAEETDSFTKGNEEVYEETEKLVATFNDAKLYGSIIQVPEINVDLIESQMNYIRNEAQVDVFTTELLEYTFPLLEDLINQYRILAKRYEVVATNPPYLNNYNPAMKKYISKHYKDYSKDLFSVFIYRNSLFCAKHGYTAFMTPMVWMFIKSYEKLRQFIIENKTISSLVHLEYSAFEEATVPLCTFVLRNERIDKEGNFVRLADFKGGMKVQEERYLNTVNNSNVEYLYRFNQNNFNKIPGSPVAYWASDSAISAFVKGIKIENVAKPKQGLATGKNDKFLRFWHEVVLRKIGFHNENRKEAEESKLKWFPTTKGGSFRKWYGNNEYIVNWEKDGHEIRNFKNESGKVRSRPQNLAYYFKEGITWSTLSSGLPSFRYHSHSIFETKGSVMFPQKKEQLKYIMGLMNTKVVTSFLQIVSPTLDFHEGPIGKVPFIRVDNKKIEDLVEYNINNSKRDWDSFETSWDFEEHPFLSYKEDSSLVSDSYNNWEEVAEERFYQLKANEEELNRIFIDIYGLQDELTPEVEEKDVTVRKADKERDVKSFLSYLVGLMFGRYSLDKKGLAYAGGEWDPSLYTQFQPDENNIIPLTAEEHFEDDIVKKAEELITLIYGKETLEENLQFIAEALNKKANESARDRIRRYFMNEFYKDHLKTYQKRPIYWQFSSGRRGAFKGLMYLHRYDRDTIARLRTDYVLNESKVLDNLIALEQNIVEDDSSSKSQKARAQKAIENYLKDKEEITQYAELLDHVARQRIELDLDDGVKVNYAKFQKIEAVQNKAGKPVKLNVFEKI